MKKIKINPPQKKTSGKKQSIKVPQKKKQMLVTLNAIFGVVSAIAFAYACYVAYLLIQFELEGAAQQDLIGNFINSLYYPIFYLVGYVFSRRAFLTRRFQTAIWFALFIPLMPFLLLSIAWN